MKADANDWSECTVVVELDDGTKFVPSSDDEGNDPGVIFLEEDTLPLLGTSFIDKEKMWGGKS